MGIHVGTSGWSYAHWEGTLYPPGTPPAARLALYCGRFATVELNASFYRWPSDRTFAGWRRRLPDGFQLSVKAPRGLTHAKRLYAPEAWVERIAASWHELSSRRGVLLVQLAPAHERDDARLEYFLARLPDWISVSVEFRHPSWHADEVFHLLERHRAAYCVMSGAGLPCILRATAPLATSACTDPTITSCTAVATRWTSCAGGRTAFGSGAAAGTMSTPTSTTTGTAMPCATPRRWSPCSRTDS